MYKDVQNSNNVDKQMLNQLVNENVIPCQTENTLKTYTKQNSKRAVFTALFFYFPKNKFIIFFLFLLIKDFFEAMTHA